MKLEKYKYISEVLSRLLNHFKENNITSCLDPVQDYDHLIEMIAKGTLDKCYGSDIHDYGFSLNINTSDQVKFYFFIFKNDDSEIGNRVIIEQYEKSIYIGLHFEDNEKFLPLVHDLMDDDGLKTSPPIGEVQELIKLNNREIMNIDEFTSFLSKNKNRGELTVIQVG